MQATDFSSSLKHQLHTLHLFTLNDLKSILVPETAFGISSALAGPLLTSNPAPSMSGVLSRLPQVVLWTYLNLLVFDLANQRLPSSVVEDSINKPWRPLPSGRLSLAQARRLLLLSIPVLIAASFFVGGLEESLMMTVLTWMYNDLKGSDEHYVVRNLVNAGGFMCYACGTTRVAIRPYRLSDVMVYQWTPLIGAVIFTTLQMQDMADQAGDAEKGRKTLPLVWGDGTARWSIAVPVMLWSLFLPAFWELEYWAWGLPLLLGMLLSGRVVLMRQVEHDKVTWKLWCAWALSLYLLPLFKDYSVFGRALEALRPLMSC